MRAFAPATPSNNGTRNSPSRGAHKTSGPTARCDPALQVRRSRFFAVEPLDVATSLKTPLLPIRRQLTDSAKVWLVQRTPIGRVAAELPLNVVKKISVS